MADADKDGQIIPSNLAIVAMRDSGYKNTAYALAELIDNAQQADANVIEVFCVQKRVQLSHREVARLDTIAVLDNGNGMGAETLRKALQFGNGTRLNDRTGIGRFGMGLPNASISQAGRVDVWSWENGPDNALHSYLDVSEIESGELDRVPPPSLKPIPKEWRDRSEGLGKSGTLILWSDLDPHRLTWKSARSTLQNTERLVGRIYRRFIADDKIRIRLCAFEEDGSTVYCQDARLDDPLYLQPLEHLPSPFDKQAMFDLLFEDPVDIEYDGQVHTVMTRYSHASQATIDEAGTNKRGDMPYGKHAARNIGVSVMRANRELMLDQGWCISYEPTERWWGVEVEFPPALDELFGVSNNKQSATHFSELAALDWKQLAEEGEDFMQVVARLKEEGDPRGYLLTLSDTLSRNISELRKIIRSQGKGLRGGPGSRHPGPDDITTTTNEKWKKRSEERPIDEDNEPTSDEELEDFREDLTENKHYSDDEADHILQIVRDEQLQVVFLEADFPDPYALFNVERKGITEITFNRRHPAFEDIFGTINTADEDVADFTKEEVIERLSRAINAAKLLFAAWARYEREAGMDKAKALEKVRFEWGQIASQFLDNGGDDL